VQRTRVLPKAYEEKKVIHSISKLDAWKEDQDQEVKLKDTRKMICCLTLIKKVKLHKKMQLKTRDVFEYVL
jgi:hypothetical protein